MRAIEGGLAAFELLVPVVPEARSSSTLSDVSLFSLLSCPFRTRLTEIQFHFIPMLPGVPANSHKHHKFAVLLPSPSSKDLLDFIFITGYQ